MTSSIVDTETLTTAEIEARKRRERILQLKRKAQNKPDDISEEKATSRTPKEPLLKEYTAEENESDNNDGDESENSPEHVTANKAESDFLDISKLASRKVDWDLKRGIEKSLAILQDRTNEIIAEIVQESAGSDENDED